MRPIRGVVLGLLVLLAGTSCTAGTQNDPVVPDQQVLTREADDALALLEKAPLEGYAAAPLASGHDRGVRPTGQRSGGARMGFVAVAGHDQPPARVDVPGDRDEAHAGILPRTRPFTLLRRSNRVRVAGACVANRAVDPGISKNEMKQSLVDKA